PPLPSSLTLLLFFFYCPGPPRDLHSFPTRRSSDLRHRLRRPRPRPSTVGRRRPPRQCRHLLLSHPRRPRRLRRRSNPTTTIRYGDRKSTRLNSSHDQISYAVFCLKKKKTQKETRIT